ncbi:MAG: dipeptide ABC transporter ATP-binding protein [Candidatus Promineifilaceae bacterium]
MANVVLEIEDLKVSYRGGDNWLAAVRDFSLRIEEGQTYGLVGESGSGKSTVALAIMRYLGPDGRVEQGSIRFDSLDLLLLAANQMRDIWGKQIALVPQNPQAALNPSIRIGEQIAEILRRHEAMGRHEARARSVELLQMVRVPDPARVAGSYPHQISGGMQQRALIAMALSTEPKLLILDEPTTGLDVTTQASILELIRELTEQRRTAVLYVTHNLGVVASICERVAVLYAGELVEDAPTGDLFSQPLHPYTEGLINSVPQIGQSKATMSLRAIPGQLPSLFERQKGCVFAARCAIAIDKCVEQRPTLDKISSDRGARCFRWPEMAAGEAFPAVGQPASTMPAPVGSQEVVLEIANLKVYFEGRRTFREVLNRRPKPVVRAVDGVTLALRKPLTLGIVGESGSGKTSLARAVLGLIERTSGEIMLLQFPLAPALDARPREVMEQLQYVFQNPDEALNPHLTVGQTLERPFSLLLGLSGPEARLRARALLQAVRLPADYFDRFPSQLSGGEKQRVAIARAFATAPDLLVADEPVSALDVSVQASILNLLQELQAERETSLILISHDLSIVGYMADQVAVMYLGRIMQLAHASSLFVPPMHPYTEALLAAIPQMEPGKQAPYTLLTGDIPSQINIPSGCPFHPRCPRYVGDICRDESPPWREIGASDGILCHIPLPELQDSQQAGLSEGARVREHKSGGG